MSVETLCAEIDRKRREFYARDIARRPSAGNMRASDISECPRESVLAITEWKSRPEPSIELAMRFRRGRKIENLAVAELQELGYHVRVDRQPFEIKDRKGRVILRGNVDGFITKGEPDPASPSKEEYPFECKSLTPNIFNRIETQEDFDRYVWFKKYPKQLQCYLYGNNFEQGFWIIDDCLGHWKLIPCRLDYERTEKILQHAELVTEHLENKTVPDFHKDPAICLKCWAFKRLCLPPFAATGEGMTVIENAELAEQIRRRAELDEAAREYDALDKEIKGVLKPIMKDGMIFIIGDYLVKANERSRKTYTVPAKKYLMFQIEALNGKGTEK